jgi:hypothetical protein
MIWKLVVGDDVDDAELNRYFELRSIIMNDTIEDADVVCTTCIAAGYHILEVSIYDLFNKD